MRGNILIIIVLYIIKLWKKSGAWFFRSLPRYTVPTRKADTPDVKNQSKRSSHERSVASSVNQVTSQSKTYSSSWSKSASKSDRHGIRAVYI